MARNSTNKFTFSPELTDHLIFIHVVVQENLWGGWWGQRLWKSDDRVRTEIGQKKNH